MSEVTLTYADLLTFDLSAQWAGLGLSGFSSDDMSLETVTSV